MSLHNPKTCEKSVVDCDLCCEACNGKGDLICNCECIPDCPKCDGKRRVTCPLCKGSGLRDEKYF